MRHALAHGNVEFISDGTDQIGSVRLQNWWNGERKWGSVVRVEDMRTFLNLFVELIERHHREVGWYLSIAA